MIFGRADAPALAQAAIPPLEVAMSDLVELKAEPRTVDGSAGARNVRRAGKIPAIIYGERADPSAITLDYLPVLKQYETGQFMGTVFAIDVDGKRERVIPRDIQLDVVRDFIMHVDFMRVKADSAIDVTVPVTFLNEDQSPGLKRGGILNIVRHDVELNCPANAIPETIEVDLAGYDIGDTVHISAVTLPAKVTPTISDRDFTIATIAGTRATVLAESEEGEGDASGEDS